MTVLVDHHPEPRIPKIIHQMWVGPPMPDYMVDCAESWTEYHPDWTFMIWNEAALEAFPLTNQYLYDNAKTISREPYQFQSDVARYEILHEYGGVWVDMDFECLKPIDEFCVYLTAWMGWEVPGEWVNNAIIGAIPGHQFLREAIAGLPASAARKPPHYRTTHKFANTVLSGPQFITPIARRNGVQFLPRQFFYPYLWSDQFYLQKPPHQIREDFPNAYAIHHWNNRRKRLG